MAALLFTGFPGFLGTELLPRILRDREGVARCIVQSRWATLARSRVQELETTSPGLAGRVELVEGDITRPQAGLADPATTLQGVQEVFHLAAVYDLTVGASAAQAVNVNGTRNVLNLADRCADLRRFHHVSTCYVSGTHAGPFMEDDLDRGQAFKNPYEETKFISEREVRARIERGMPATVYRPASVVGDSGSGATQKLDGAYMFIRFILRQGPLAMLPVVGDPYRVLVNIVPRDFVVSAIATLSLTPSSVGRTYHVADAAPESVGGMLDAIATAAGSRLVRVRTPLRLVKSALRRVPDPNGVDRDEGLDPINVVFQ